ncbi:hypothetical protein NP233_g6166 [Leucocoprinus birnbaumii]|uniref:Chromatin elongation factor spt5 n=1 Tax=Leucocoprinus birnbaumii TaxID=56174 RepID=A0AAD5VV10_9AGAR|nr:hypothetical protein NP233_g6166 [Leucocoprinus birnbaumii]
MASTIISDSPRPNPKSKNDKGKLIEFGRLQKIVAYFEKSRLPKIFWAEAPADGKPWTFVSVRDFESLTGSPAKKQEVFDIKLDKFVPVEDFTPHPMPPNAFYITKPAEFHFLTCFCLGDYITELKQLYKGDSANNKRKLSSEADPNPRLKKRLVNPQHYRLGEVGRTRVKRAVKPALQPFVEIPVRRRDTPRPAAARWAEVVASALNEVHKAAGPGEQSDVESTFEEPPQYFSEQSDSSSLDVHNRPTNSQTNDINLQKALANPPPQKRARVRKPRRNDFVDLEAAVSGNEDSGDDDEEDETEGVGGGRNEDDDEDVFEHMTLLSRFHLENEVNQGDSLISIIMKNYVTNSSAHSGHEVNARREEMDKFEYLNAGIDPELKERLRAHMLMSIPPTDDDWETWEVPVPMRKEEIMISRIMTVADSGGVHRRSTPPRSVFASPGIHDRIFVEAHTRLDVITLHDDLTRSSKRPAASPFDPQKALTISGPASVLTEGSGLTARHCYFDIRPDYKCPFDSFSSYDASGFLDLVVDNSQYFQADVYPQLSEMTHFMNCVSIPHTTKLLALRLAENRRLKNGDQVVIIPTSVDADSIGHIGRIGVIDDITSTTAYVCFLLDHADLSETVQLPLSSLRRHYRIGDYIRVKAGTLQGLVGWVTCINDVEEQITVCDSNNPENQFDVLMSLTEFTEVSLKLGRNRGSSATYMRQYELSAYENLPVTVVNGPLKGQSGIVKTISSTQKAAVELRGSHSLRNKLDELHISDLAFELDLHSWYRLEAKQYGVFEDHLEPQFPNPEDTPLTPVGDPSIEPISRPESSPTQENPLGCIPTTFWMMKLPYCDTFKTLKLLIRSCGTYENGRWDRKVGFYKGLSGDRVKFFMQDSGLISIPFYYVYPVHPTGGPQNAHCLAEGPDFGKRFKVQVFGEHECEVIPFRGGRVGSGRKIPTADLAVIG